jgi:hypothetical protein
MTNHEKAIKAKEIIGDKKMMECKFTELNTAYYTIYGEYLKRSCLNTIRHAYNSIQTFIKAHENSSNNS